MMTMKIPLHVTLPRKTKAGKKIILNLNNYPKWHYTINSEAKIRFCEDMRTSLSGVKLKYPVIMRYVLSKASARKCDRMNALCVIDKFFCDALVNHGCLPDDSDEYILRSEFESDGIDRENPGATVTVFERGDY